MIKYMNKKARGLTANKMAKLLIADALTTVEEYWSENNFVDYGAMTEQEQSDIQRMLVRHIDAIWTKLDVSKVKKVVESIEQKILEGCGNDESGK